LQQLIAEGLRSSGRWRKARWKLTVNTEREYKYTTYKIRSLLRSGFDGFLETWSKPESKKPDTGSNKQKKWSNFYNLVFRGAAKANRSWLRRVARNRVTSSPLKKLTTSRNPQIGVYLQRRTNFLTAQKNKVLTTSAAYRTEDMRKNAQGGTSPGILRLKVATRADERPQRRGGGSDKHACDCTHGLGSTGGRNLYTVQTLTCVVQGPLLVNRGGGNVNSRAYLFHIRRTTFRTRPRCGSAGTLLKAEASFLKLSSGININNRVGRRRSASSNLTTYQRDLT